MVVAVVVVVVVVQLNCCLHYNLTTTDSHSTASSIFGTPERFRLQSCEPIRFVWLRCRLGKRPGSQQLYRGAQTAKYVFGGFQLQ